MQIDYEQIGESIVKATVALSLTRTPIMLVIRFWFLTALLVPLLA